MEKFQAARVQIVGISYDKVETLKAFSDAEEIPFLLLSDDDSQTIKAYGLHFEKGLPHPGTVLVDQRGTIRAKLFEDGYRDRHDSEKLLQAAKQLK